MSKIYLNESNSAWIEIDELSPALKQYAMERFDELFEEHPRERGKTLLFNKNVENPEWEENNSFRYHKSYMQTPDFNPESMKSYMFSGEDKSGNNGKFPELFEPFYEYIKSQDARYNQMVINWYEKEDFIPLHSDCTHSMIDNASIWIVNINRTEEEKEREFTIIPKKTNEDYLYEKYTVPLKHGIMIKMCGDMQKMFSHGVDCEQKTKRISLSFRQY